jgi:prepilin-type N-terminal cleavage/methylation domain-containing protein
MRLFKKGRAFTLVELLVVIGIIGMLIAILLPSLSRAQKNAKQIQCASNLKQIGNYLVIYLNNWNGWLFPPNLGANKPREERWPIHVFNPPVWNPRIMLCPEDWEPAEEHSYLLNNHLADRAIKFSSRALGGKTTSDVIVMGEKRSSYPDYYMNRGDFNSRVEPYRHGISQGSNYLYLDMHVSPARPEQALIGIDPWDISNDPMGPRPRP